MTHTNNDQSDEITSTVIDQPVTNFNNLDRQQSEIETEKKSESSQTSSNCPQASFSQQEEFIKIIKKVSK